jgi:hypothetical protein
MEMKRSNFAVEIKTPQSFNVFVILEPVSVLPLYI